MLGNSSGIVRGTTNLAVARLIQRSRRAMMDIASLATKRNFLVNIGTSKNRGRRSADSAVSSVSSFEESCVNLAIVLAPAVTLIVHGSTMKMNRPCALRASLARRTPRPRASDAPWRAPRTLRRWSVISSCARHATPRRHLVRTAESQLQLVR